ncbi:hypothetical protein CoNPh12_CDS0185 [Staphylococcus phage S-CoN_Ph12]|nr:hypothetical protein CoNPh12_CDS0185 [Staphylococcus phage S-CoN_Ph12]
MYTHIAYTYIDTYTHMLHIGLYIRLYIYP